jgi:hypothetical protein
MGFVADGDAQSPLHKGPSTTSVESVHWPATKWLPSDARQILRAECKTGSSAEEPELSLNMNRKTLVAAVFALLFTALQVSAVKVDRPEEAENNATHIVSGKVTAVYSKITRTEKEETAHCVAEIQVEKVERGGGLKTGSVLYVRYLGSKRWLGGGPPAIGPGPHDNCPSEGQSVRVRLVRAADGGFDVYYVSGFERPKP